VGDVLLLAELGHVGDERDAGFGILVLLPKAGLEPHEPMHRVAGSQAGSSFRCPWFAHDILI
jgi:hypothetical protein